MRIQIALMAFVVVCRMLSTPGLAADPGTPGPEALQSSELHNLFRLTPRLLSGSAPEGDRAFAELKQLGITTIITVDGAPPDVATARRYGFRYIHLPIGYDGIPAERLVELVAAARVSQGPIYVHCHHGKHRGPAAAAVICEATAGWSADQALAWLQLARTAPEYAGLYQSVREFRAPTAAELAKVTELPETTRTTPMVAAMIAIDGHADHLKSAQAVSWKDIPGYPERSPLQEANLLWEQFREINRRAETPPRPGDFHRRIHEAAELARQLREALAPGSLDLPTANAAFKSLGQSCSTCHQTYRN